MSKVQVLHKEDGQFVLVAIVTVPDTEVYSIPTNALEYAWMHTNNVDGSWSQGPKFADGMRNSDYHPDVKVMAPLHTVNGRTYGIRSSMMGDLFILNDKCYTVAMAGFAEME